MLMGTKPVYNSGMEKDEFEAYAIDSFQELLDTSPIIDTVTLYNYNLSDSKELQCVVQNNTADTQLKTMERQILCSIGMLKAGMYIFYHDSYWLVTGMPDNNKIYEKATLALCQYKLRWQKSDGTILERWCNMTSAAKYDVGESGNSTIVLTTNNFTLLLPNDEDSMTIDNKRIFIDRNKDNPQKVFKISRNDDSLYDYGNHGGVLSVIADKTELNTEKDNKELMICDYIKSNTSPPPTVPDEYPDRTTVFLKIESPRDILKIGGQYVTFTGIVSDVDGNVIDAPGTFEFVCSFDASKIIVSEGSGNKIKLKISNSDNELIGQSFQLIFAVGDESVSKSITISDYL